MQSSQIVFLVIVFLVIIIIGGVFIFFYIKLSKKEEKKNLPILINLDSKHSDGRAVCVITKEEVGAGKRKKITLNPRDVDVDKETEDEMLIISDNLLEFPRGSLSNDREIKMNLPISSENLPEQLKNSDLGKMLSKFIEKTNEENNIIKSLRESRNRQDILNLALGGGELSRQQIAKLAEILEEIQKVVKSDKKDEGLPHM